MVRQPKIDLVRDKLTSLSISIFLTLSMICNTLFRKSLVVKSRTISGSLDFKSLFAINSAVLRHVVDEKLIFYIGDCEESI